MIFMDEVLPKQVTEEIQNDYISNPFSTGGGGANFETHVQAAFVVLMLTGGFAPCLPVFPIKKIKLQGKHIGYNTDDFIAYTQDPNSNQEYKLLAQIKHSVSISQSNLTFAAVIESAWKDFCNPKLFDPQKDTFALITCPLSTTDIEDVRRILEWARHSESAYEFITKIQKGNFSSDHKRQKLTVFQSHLNNSKGSNITDDELWSFMKSFHLLGYDLDIKSGVTHSLLKSLIGQYSPKDAEKVWLQIVEEVQYANQDAGTLSIDTVSPEIQAAFKKPKIQEIPQEFVKKAEIEVQAEDTLNKYAPELAIATLLGAWDESSDNDKKAIEKLSDISYCEWITKMREILAQSKSPLTLINGKWKITKRLDLWNTLGPRIFDDHLVRFKEISVNILRERDPKFDLSKDERFLARVKGKVLLHSQLLRNAIAEGLALVGSYPKVLTHCTLHKPENIVTLAVREILNEKDWIIWASLNDILPLLAEAAPDDFINAVEVRLNDRDAKTFQSLFAQEGDGSGGWNYMTGILWALETLAWHPDYLVRVTVILGRLSEIDPGGNWANRPVNSLRTIFLPWHPQTCGNIEKRKTAIETLLKECPTIGWKLLLALLPSPHQISFENRKPVWRESILKNCVNLDKVPSTDYFEQIKTYVTLLFQHAKADIGKLKELVTKLGNLPEQLYLQTLDYLSSKEISNMPEQERLPLWETLIDIVIKHRKFSDTKWAFQATEVDRIYQIAETLKPSSPKLLYKRLFDRHENQLFCVKGEYDIQRQNIEKQRTKAINTIIATSGIHGVIDFAKSVAIPSEVGLALGRIDHQDTNSYFLPSKLLTEERYLEDIMHGYIWSKFSSKGWGWIEEVKINDWTNEQKAAFLVLLPFTSEAWQKVRTLLGEKEHLYWENVDVRPYRIKELHEAVEKLLQYGRPRAAISCLNWMLYEKMEIPLEHTYKALIASPTSEESSYSLDQNDSIELIKWLQNNPVADKGTLSQIEWIYLPLLDHYLSEAPRILEQKLANEPEFFCAIISSAFRSTKPENNPKEITKEQRQNATRAYELLHNWKTPPGTNPDGVFDPVRLNKWIDEVRGSCENSGHLDIALAKIGEVFAHSQPDPNGLWIHKAIAEILNEKDADEMRSGFVTGRLRMRGVFWGSKGKQEKGIAEDYRKNADAVEKEGYSRLASTIRELSIYYERLAEREATRDPYEILQ